jgi:hypothetical protein
MDEFWASSTFLTRLTYWSVTHDILLNSRMTNSPVVSLVGILMVNPSGLLFHILSSTIFSESMGVSGLCFPLSALMQTNLHLEDASRPNSG